MKKLIFIFFFVFWGLSLAREIDLSVLNYEPIFKTTLNEIAENPSKKAEVLSEITKIWSVDEQKREILSAMLDMGAEQVKGCENGKLSDKFFSTLKKMGASEKDISFFSNQAMFPAYCKNVKQNLGGKDFNKITLADYFKAYVKYLRKIKNKQ